MTRGIDNVISEKLHYRLVHDNVRARNVFRGEFGKIVEQSQKSMKFTGKNRPEFSWAFAQSLGKKVELKKFFY